jgi:hypothetical protein
MEIQGRKELIKKPNGCLCTVHQGLFRNPLRMKSKRSLGFLHLRGVGLDPQDYSSFELLESLTTVSSSLIVSRFISSVYGRKVDLTFSSDSSDRIDLKSLADALFQNGSDKLDLSQVLPVAQELAVVKSLDCPFPNSVLLLIGNEHFYIGSDFCCHGTRGCLH